MISRIIGKNNNFCTINYYELGEKFYLKNLVRNLLASLARDGCMVVLPESTRIDCGCGIDIRLSSGLRPSFGNGYIRF
jgi:hypothetical protein